MCVAVLKYEWKKRCQTFFVGVLQGRDVDINEENGFYCCAEHAVLCHGTYRFAVRKSPFRVTMKSFPMNKNGQSADCQTLVWNRQNCRICHPYRFRLEIRCSQRVDRTWCVCLCDSHCINMRFWWLSVHWHLTVIRLHPCPVPVSGRLSSAFVGDVARRIRQRSETGWLQRWEIGRKSLWIRWKTVMTHWCPVRNSVGGVFRRVP